MYFHPLPESPTLNLMWCSPLTQIPQWKMHAEDLLSSIKAKHHYYKFFWATTESSSDFGERFLNLMGPFQEAELFSAELARVCPHCSRGCHCTELHLLVASAIAHPWCSAFLATPPASPHLCSYLRKFSFPVQSNRNQGLKGFCGSCLAPPLAHRNSAIPKFVHEEGEEGAGRLSGSKLLLAWLWLAPSTGVKHLFTVRFSMQCVSLIQAETIFGYNTISYLYQGVFYRTHLYGSQVLPRQIQSSWQEQESISLTNYLKIVWADLLTPYKNLGSCC